MKFITIATAVALAMSTTNAIDQCDIMTLLPIASGPDAEQCGKDSGFSLVTAAITGVPPSESQYPAICGSKACTSVLDQLYTAVPDPTDCQLRNGKTLKELTGPVKAACTATRSLANVPPCDIIQLFPIVNGADSSQCEKDSGFSLVVAAITEIPPTPDQYPAICASAACKSVLNQLYVAVPTDCQLSGGKLLKALTDPVKSACQA